MAGFRGGPKKARGAHAIEWELDEHGHIGMLKLDETIMKGRSEAQVEEQNDKLGPEDHVWLTLCATLRAVSQGLPQIVNFPAT
jgi:hypothetical protein